MPAYTPRFLLVVVWLFLLSSFLVRAGLPPADAGPFVSATLHGSAWNFLPVVHGQVPGPTATATKIPYCPPDNRWLLHHSFYAGAGWN